MKNEQHIEKVFDLLELYNFNELTQADKQLVLSVMTEVEYQDMRTTIGASKSYFDKEPLVFVEKAMETKQFSFPQVLKYAAVAVILVSVGFVGGKFSSSLNEVLIASNDTVYMEKLDTIFSVKRDTIKTRELITVATSSYAQAANIANPTTDENKPMEMQVDCSMDFCPNDMDLIAQSSTKNNMSNNRELEEYIPSIEQ
ncbi:MAG: hypothetical protein JXQ69_04380 [Paludibacteraceae bacterium]|nr:hypothetical protein [Paludibacteraceae bacterium]MBN2787544.1 hypothetical protein [Paludibacteraceae bacterium]